MIEYQGDQPSYPKILWNRPVNRAAARRLLLVGGYQSNIANLQAVYQITIAAGIGAITVLAPDALRPMLGTVPELRFAASTVSGSLAKGAESALNDLSSGVDATLVGPNLSNNSETSITIENWLAHYQQPLILADDGLELIGVAPDAIITRPKTLIILTMQQLFHLAGKLQVPLQIKPDAGVAGKIDIIEDFWKTVKVDLALVGSELIVKVGEQVSVTRLAGQLPMLPIAATGTLAVFYAQNQADPYQGLTTSAYLIKQAVDRAAGPTINELVTALRQSLESNE